MTTIGGGPDRSINETEAEVVRRIFRAYAAGKSAKRIAVELNEAGVPAPSGADWGFSTINGNPKRGTGILNNELYIGRLIWNRQRFVKDPDTGKRQARPNPESECVAQEVPKLRIVDDALWQATSATAPGACSRPCGPRSRTGLVRPSPRSATGPGSPGTRW